MKVERQEFKKQLVELKTLHMGDCFIDPTRPLIIRIKGHTDMITFGQDYVITIDLEDGYIQLSTVDTLVELVDSVLISEGGL